MGNPVTRLDWSAGCGTFGRLTRPDGSVELIETLWFGEREAALVVLSSGDRAILDCAHAGLLLSVLPVEVACAEVCMPVPGRIKVGDGWRRVDPFHSERHRSVRFRALTRLIYERQLPCRYSMLRFAAGETAGEHDGPCVEDPEQTAGNVAERLAREPGLRLADALHAELLADALCAVNDAATAQELLDRAGWSALLPELEHELASYSTALPESIAALQGGTDSQLDLFQERRSYGGD
jgi:hypothetical protein